MRRYNDEINGITVIDYELGKDYNMDQDRPFIFVQNYITDKDIKVFPPSTTFLKNLDAM